jgi:hypothetical protein
MGHFICICDFVVVLGGKKYGELIDFGRGKLGLWVELRKWVRIIEIN